MLAKVSGAMDAPSVGTVSEPSHAWYGADLHAGALGDEGGL